MNEPIPVEARFELDGSLTPLAFEWQGQRYKVESHGRQWDKNDARHFLVMASGDQVFELVYVQGENQWRLGRSPHDFKRHPYI